MQKEIVDTDEILIIGNEIEGRTVEDLKKEYPDKINKIEALINCIGENDLKILKTKVPDIRWKHLTKKLAYPYENFNSLDDYQKPVDNVKKEEFFNKLKITYPIFEELERTKGSIKYFNIKNGELTK